MGKEIERKFLVCDKSFMRMAESSTEIRQAYLSTSPDATVRVRIAGAKAFITVKSRNRGASRDEWEYDVPVSDAEEMIAACCGHSLVSKRRYVVPYGAHRWEIDVFDGRLAGLTVAEVELREENEPVAIPPFIGREVTGDTRYYNSSLSCPSAPVPASE